MRTQPLDLSNATGPKLKVWWIPQIPMKPFEVLVSSFSQAKVLLDTLAQYDLFQLENNIKQDFSNAGGVMIFDDGDWTDYRTDESEVSPDEQIEELTLEQCVELDAAWMKRLDNRRIYLTSDLELGIL